MEQREILKGKHVLIVDDEPDILETLEEMLDTCLIDTAPNFQTAEKFLKKNHYDIAILDIMGVRGYDLLELCGQMNIPAVMLTAHALSPENLIKSIKKGAQAYVPKDKITDIATYVGDVLEACEKGLPKHGKWFSRLQPFFEKKFGPGWRDKDKNFWEVFEKTYRAKREDVDGLIASKEQ
jgi:CheY-like chemotaxis protein